MKARDGMTRSRALIKYLRKEIVQGAPFADVQTDEPHSQNRTACLLRLLPLFCSFGGVRRPHITTHRSMRA